MKQFLKLSLLTTTAVWIASAAPAAAQSASDGNTLDTVVVTARRMEERLQDVPISMTVFSQQQLSNRNVTNAADLATYTPSLSSNNLFGSDNTTFSIRGFVQDIGTAPSVGVYFADVVAPRGASNGINVGDGAGPGMMFDLQNLQVLRGPQGTLFGRNTTGGAILLVPQKPGRDFEGYVEGSVGNYDMRRLQGVVNLPLGERFRLRLGVDRQTRDGYLINDSGIGPRDFANINYTAFRASFVADLTDDLENYTIFNYSKSHNHGGLAKVFVCNNTPSPANFIGLQACGNIQSQAANGFYHVNNDLPNAKSDLRQWQLINTTTWHASDNLTIKNIVSYAELKDSLNSALFGVNLFIAPGVGLDFVRSVPIPGLTSSNQYTATEELQFQGRALSDKLTWQAGGYLEISRPLDKRSGAQSPTLLSCSDSDRFECLDFTGFGALNYTAGATRYRNVGLYAQATYDLTDKLKLTGGVRYTWDRTRTNSELINYRFPTFPAVGAPTPFCTRPGTVLPTCTLALGQDSKAPTWLIDLDYKPNEDLLFYGKWVRGYRSGGVKVDSPVEYNSFQPEHVDTFELGAKTSFSGAVPGNFNIAAFYNDFRDQQLQFYFNDNPNDLTGVSPTAGPVNAGKSRIYGVEVNATVRPFKGFTLDGSYTYLNTKVKSIAPVTLPASSPFVVSGEIRPGDELTYSPDHKWSLTASYVLPLEEAVGKVTVAATWTHIGRQRFNYADRDPAVLAFTGGVDVGVQSAYDLLDANLTWNSIGGKPVDLSLFATNLTKEKYFAFVSPLFPSIGFETATLGEPRMYGLRLRYRFGG